MSTDSAGLKPRLLTYREAGIYLGVCERTVWSMVDRGEIRAIHFGRSVRIDRHELDRFIDEQGHDENGEGLQKR